MLGVLVCGVVAAMAAAAAAIPACAAAAPSLVADRCGGGSDLLGLGDLWDEPIWRGWLEFLDFTGLEQNDCPRYACRASVAGANPGNARDLPFADCNLDALEVDGKVLQQQQGELLLDVAPDELRLVPDSIAAGDGHAFCAVGDSAGAIVQEQRALPNWPRGGATAIVARLSSPVRAAVVCLASLNMRRFVLLERVGPPSLPRVRFTTSNSDDADGASTTASWTATALHGRQCFSLQATAAFDTLRVANANVDSADGVCVQSIETACDDGTGCTRDYGDSNPPPARTTNFCPAHCAAGPSGVLDGEIGGGLAAVCVSSLDACGGPNNDCSDSFTCGDDNPFDGLCAANGACCSTVDAGAACCGPNPNCRIVATGSEPAQCLFIDALPAPDLLPSTECSFASLGQPCTTNGPDGGDSGICMALGRSIGVRVLCAAGPVLAALTQASPCDL